MNASTDARPTAAPRRREGRPASVDDPKQRARHLAVTIDLLALRIARGTNPVADVARLHGISPRSVKRYMARALRYEGDAADEVRRFRAHDPIGRPA